MDLATARALRTAGKHEEARQLLLALAQASPEEAELQFELACVHESLGLEAQDIARVWPAGAG